jgi:hypothetical protein
MWDILNDSIPDLSLLNKICLKLTSFKKDTIGIYQKLLGITTNCYEFLGLMSLYARYIVFDDLLLNEISENIKGNHQFKIDYALNLDVKDYCKKINIMNDDCCSVSISFNFENLGQINWTSSHCYKIFGYDSHYMRTLGIAHIQPSIVATYHPSFLENFFDRGEGRLLNNTTHLWAIDNQKCLFSV